MLGDDFFGVQNYTRTCVNAEGEIPMPKDPKQTQMGYENYPQSLEHVIRAVSKELKLPIMVTENGIAVSDNCERIVFIKEALSGVRRCIEDGISVIGYLHWSLLDKFEWQSG